MSAPAETTAAPVDSVEEGHRIYVGNLAFSATEDQVREHFAKTGDIISVILPTRFKSRRPAGYAFVTYKNEEDAKNAVEKLNGTEIGERKINLEIARSKEENAERKADILAKRKANQKPSPKKEGEAAAGETTAVDSDKSTDKAKAKPKKKAAKASGRRRGPDDDDDTAVEGEQDGEAKKKTKPKKKADEARIDGEEKKPKEPKERKPRLQLTGEVSKNTVFVANLPFNIDDDALSAIFTDLTIKVKSAHVIKGLRRLPGRRPFRGSKGFGFVVLDDEAQQNEAVDKVNGTAVGDRKITAKVAQEMKPIEEIQAEQDKADADAEAKSEAKFEAKAEAA